MSEHLSSERIFESITGNSTQHDEAHLRVCPSCDAEIRLLQSSIAGLSQALRDAAERNSVRPTPQMNWAGLQHCIRPRPTTWILTAAAIAMAVAIPVYERNTDTREQAVRERDARLLEEVDSQLSREVPASMESLMELMQQDKE